MEEKQVDMKMTPWRLERLGNGSLRCARNEEGDEKKAEYRSVPVPNLLPAQIAAIANLGIAMQGAVDPYDIAEMCYDAEYNRNARRILDTLAKEAR